MEKKLKEKIFHPRNSLLTDLFNINHFNALYNIFFTVFSILLISSAVLNYFQPDLINVGSDLVSSSFGSIFTVIRIWTTMQLSTFALFFGFHVWAHLRRYLISCWYVGYVDFIFLGAFIIFQTAFVVYPAKYLTSKNVAPASSLAILMEQARMLMKTHAFVRHSAPKVMSTPNPKDDGETKVYLPKFSRFVYFMFAPTLVYRDEYPRSEKVRWKMACWNFAEVVMMTICLGFVLKHSIISEIEKYGKRIFEIRNVSLTLINMVLPSTFMFLCGFYLLLHSWQNGMAELLRFADRLFYRDWWNCTNYDEYHRTWNVIVHDWFYTYVYKEAREKFGLSKTKATLAVFFISAVFHEYILALSFRFFYPVLFVLFGVFGVIVIFVMKKYAVGGNNFMWFSLISGNTIIFTLYSIEFYARLHCPAHSNQLYDILVPRSWTCQ